MYHSGGGGGTSRFGGPTSTRQQGGGGGASKPIVDQSLVMAQCYYDFRHHIGTGPAGKGPASARRALPLPSVLRIPTTETTTQTFRGTAAAATLAKHGLYLDVHNRLAARTVLSGANNAAGYAGVEGEGSSPIQRDGEERVIRFTKKTVTTRRTDPIPITGDHILAHALGSLFFSSWQVYRSTVFESHDGEADSTAVGGHRSGSAAVGRANSDPLLAELTQRSEALDRQGPSGGSSSPVDYREGALGAANNAPVVTPSGRKGSDRSFMPFEVSVAAVGAVGHNHQHQQQMRANSYISLGAPADVVGGMGPKAAASHIAALVERFERAHVAKHRRAVAAQQQRGGGGGGGGGMGSAGSSRRTTTACSADDLPERDSIQTLIELLDACDVGTMATTAMAAMRQQRDGSPASSPLAAGGNSPSRPNTSSTNNRPGIAPLPFDAMSAICPRYVFSDLLDPAYLAARDEAEGTVHATNQGGVVGGSDLVPSFLRDLLLSADDAHCASADGAAQPLAHSISSTSPYAEVRILSDVVRRFNALTAAMIEADAREAAKGRGGHGNNGGGSNSLLGQERRIEQLRRLHKQHMQQQEEGGGSSLSTVAQQQQKPKSSLVSLLSEPALWYQLLDEAVESFIDQHQYGISPPPEEGDEAEEDEAEDGGAEGYAYGRGEEAIEGDGGAEGDDVVTGANLPHRRRPRPPAQARLYVRSPHFTDPSSQHYYLMRGKKAVLRALCLSLVTHFDTRVGDVGASALDKRPLLPSRYKEDYTLFISKPDGTLLPSWEEFCDDCQVPSRLTTGNILKLKRLAGVEGVDDDRRRRRRSSAATTGDGDEADGDDGGDADDDGLMTVSADPLVAAYSEAVYRFDALNDARLVKDYLAPRLQERLVGPRSTLVGHPMAMRTQQYRQISSMHPQQQLATLAQPSQTAMDYIPLTFTVCFTPRHPMTTGLHIAASSVKALTESPTALFVDRSPLLWVPDALIAQGGSSRLRHGGSNGAATAQSTLMDVTRVFGDLAAGVARLLLKALCVSTLHDVSLAINAGGRRPPRTVVTSYISMASSSATPQPTAAAQPQRDGHVIKDSGDGLFVSRNARGLNIFTFDGTVIGDGQANDDVGLVGTPLRRHQQTKQQQQIPLVVDPASAALALQLLTQEDGHGSAKVRNTAGLLEDRLAAQRGAHRLGFLPPLQLPYRFVASMRSAEMFEINTFLLHSNANTATTATSSSSFGEGGGGGGGGERNPFAVLWQDGAEDDDVGDAAAALYADGDGRLPQRREGDAAEQSAMAMHAHYLDARELLRHFTLPQLSMAQRSVADIVVLPTILVPERAGKARATAEAFVGTVLDAQHRGRGGISRGAMASDGFGYGPIACGYSVAVQQQLALDKGIDTTTSSSSSSSSSAQQQGGKGMGHHHSIPYEGALSDLEALAGTTSLSALWEEAGMSAYDLALYGGGRVGAIPLLPPRGVCTAGGGNTHGSAYRTAVGRVAAANAPLAHVVGRYNDPTLGAAGGDGSAAPPVAVGVLAKQASRACQRLGPSFVAQELDRQRMANVEAVARTRAEEDEGNLRAHTNKVRAAIKRGGATAAASPSADASSPSASLVGKQHSSNFNLVDAIMSEGIRSTLVGGPSGVGGGYGRRAAGATAGDASTASAANRSGSPFLSRSSPSPSAAVSMPLGNGVAPLDQRMHAGKKAFDHIVKAGLRKVAAEDAALGHASTHLNTLGGIGSRSYAGRPIVARSTATSLLDAEGEEERLRREQQGVACISPLLSASYSGPSPSSSTSAVPYRGAHGGANGAFAPHDLNASAPAIMNVNKSTTMLGSANTTFYATGAGAGAGGGGASSQQGAGHHSATTTISRQTGEAIPHHHNLSAMPNSQSASSAASASGVGIFQPKVKPLSFEERMARQHAQLDRRMAAKALSRTLRDAGAPIGGGAVAGGGGALTDADIDLVANPSTNKMSLYVLQNLRPELRRLNAEERQAIEEGALVRDLGEQCAAQHEAHVGGLRESTLARHRVRDVTAEVEDTKAIETSLVGRKRLGRQAAKAHDASLAGGLQRLLIDSALDGGSGGQPSYPLPSSYVRQQDGGGVGATSAYNTAAGTFNLSPYAKGSAALTASDSRRRVSFTDYNDGTTNAGDGTTMSTLSTIRSTNNATMIAASGVIGGGGGGGGGGAHGLPTVTNTSDDRSLGFEHLMSRDRTAAYML